MLIFTYADTYEPDKNRCEREALQLIAQSAKPVIALTGPYNVLSWEPIRRPEDSEMNARLLQLWRVTKGKTYYYNK